jgi:hypothetical protein
MLGPYRLEGSGCLRAAGRVAALAALLAIGTAATARAEAEAEPPPLARKLFREGIEASRARDWERARDAFARSYQVAPRPISLLNLAGAQSQLGELVEAAQNYRRFLRLATSGSAAERRAVAEKALARTEARLAYLDIESDGLAEGSKLRIDGKPVSLSALDEPVPMNPGSHTIVLTSPGRDAIEKEVTLVEGQRRTLRLGFERPWWERDRGDVPSPEEAARQQPLEGEQGDDEPSAAWWGTVEEEPTDERQGDGTGSAQQAEPSGLSRPVRIVLWTAGAVVLAGAAATGVALATSGPEPFQGNLTPGRIVVR